MGYGQANAPYTFAVTGDCVDTWETATRPQEHRDTFGTRPVPRTASSSGVTWLGQAFRIIPENSAQANQRRLCFSGRPLIGWQFRAHSVVHIGYCRCQSGPWSNLAPLFVCVSFCCLGEWRRRCCRLVPGRNLWSVPIGPSAGGRR